ncbi:MAG: hypothetical protein AAGG56_00955 [Pseudomonadota bacterium]
MQSGHTNLLDRAATLCRAVAATLIAGVWRKHSAREMNAWIAGRSERDQGLIIGGSLLALFVTSLAAAQFGWIGLLLFMLVLVVVVN